MTGYRIANRANRYRTTLPAPVLTVLEKACPTLFAGHEMRR